MNHYRYMGMSYQQLSMSASDLLKRAVESGNWHSILQDLIFIKNEMVIHPNKG